MEVPALLLERWSEMEDLHPHTEPKPYQNPGALEAEELDAAIEEAGLDADLAKRSSGAHWFYWLAGLSLVNSLIVVFGGAWSFLFGLGLTQLIDALLLDPGSSFADAFGVAPRVAALFLTSLVLLSFVFLGRRADQGAVWAFNLGIGIYLVDALLFLWLQDWLALAFHGYVLYVVFAGRAAAVRLRQRAQDQTAETRFDSPSWDEPT